MNTFPDIVIALLGGVTAAAKFFGVTVGAVPQWRHNGFPPARELELMKRRPDIYAEALRAASDLKEAA